jgi:hypothetical protein
MLARLSRALGPGGQLAPHERSLFLAFCATYGLAYFPLITRDIYYIDDIGRMLRGNFEWWVGGRPLADVLFWAISLGGPALDLAPLTQILATAILAVASVLVCRTLPNSPALLKVLAIAPLGLQPYWLENISYRFDSLGMALSLLCAVAPWGLRIKGLLQVALTAVLCLMCLNLYQPSFNAFCVLFAYRAVALFIREPADGDVAWTLRVGLGGALGIAIYTPLAKAQLPDNDYVQGHAALPALLDAPRHIVANAGTAFDQVVTEWRGTTLGAICALVILLGGLAAVWAAAAQRDGGRRSRGTRLLRVPASLLVVPASFCAMHAIQLPLLWPVWQARTFVGLGLALAVAGALLAAHAPRALATALLAVQAAAMITFCFAYANYAEDQNRYDRQLATRIVYDIEALRTRAAVTHVNFDGVSGYSRPAQIAVGKYPILRKLIPIYMRERWGFGAALLNFFGLDISKGTLPRDTVEQTICSSTPPVRNSRYAIFLSGTTAIIHFTASGTPCPN